MNASKETMCSHCAHLSVCMFKEQYLELVKTIDDFRIVVGYEKSVHIRDMTWIESLVPKCKYYSENKNCVTR